MSPPRIIVPGATTAITRRTTLRKAYLGPWDPMVVQCWLYAMADAQRHTGVAIHLGQLVMNHEHLDVTPSFDNLPEFTKRLHRDTSCALNTLLGKHRYDTPRELFDGRACHYKRLCDDAEQAKRLVYDRVNCVAAGLVDRPEHMPGSVFDFECWRRGYIDVKRPPVYFSQNDRVRPETIRMEVTPPPLLYEAFGGDMERLIYHMNRLTDYATRRIKAARKFPALGASAVRRIHPWSEPTSLRESGGGPNESFGIGERGEEGREKTIRAALEVREFRRTYREVRLARREGKEDLRFPHGTYAMRTVHNAPVEPEAPPDAIVAQPGPLLSDVEARLQKRRSADEVHAASIVLIEKVRSEIDDEAQERSEEELMRFATARAPSRTQNEAAAADDQAQNDAAAANAPVTRHRLDHQARHHPAHQAGPHAAPRIIVLRDNRLGRPPTRHRHGADPPA